MGWLADGGTDFAYRMSLEIGNSAGTWDRAIVVPFPAWFLYATGKIQQSSYADIRVTKDDGTTQLRCRLNADKNTLYIDYPALPLGRQTLYVYYGHATAAAPTAAWFGQGESGGDAVESGFEDKTASATLSAVWGNSQNAPASKIYDHTNPRSGSLMEAKIVAASGALYSGVYETVSAGMTADTAEIRFWIYHNETTTYKIVAGYSSTQPFYVRFNNNGDIVIYTEHSGHTGYTQNNYTVVGTYTSGGWMEYRIVLNFTAGTYTLSRRSAVDASWTYLKSSGASDNNIPMRSLSPTQTLGVQFLGYDGAIFWFDNLQYANAGITDSINIWAVQPMRPNWEKTSEADTNTRVYIWGTELEATELNSGSANTYYGASASHRAGIAAAGSKYHYLIKPFEGAFLKGTVDEVKLHLHIAANSDVDENLSLRCHRFLTTSRAAWAPPYAPDLNEWDYYTRAGWTLQASASLPTWNNRFLSYRNASTTIAWQTAGAVGADEIDSAEYLSLALSVGFTVGYKTLDITPSWITDWMTDDFSLGLLLKDSTDSAGANDRFVAITAPGQVNSPVLEVNYSSLDESQLTRRKVSSDTYTYATFAGHDRYIVTPSDNDLALLAWINADMGLSLAYISTNGRITRAQDSIAPASGRLSINSPGFGLYYDAYDGRYWFAGVDSNGKLCLAYSLPYYANGSGSWIWSTNTAIDSAKSQLAVKNGVAHIVTYHSDSYLKYLTYTRSTDTWGSTTNLVAGTVGGTQRALLTGHSIGSGDVMTGAGVLWLDGSIADYASCGVVKIDSEYFWYASKDGPNNKLTEVTRAMFNSTAANHAVGATVAIDRTTPTYVSIAIDAAKSVMHVVYSVASSSPAPNYAYIYTGYMKHYFADAATVWKDQAENALTLPVDNRTEIIVSPPGINAFHGGILVNSDDDLLVTNMEYQGDGRGGTSYGGVWVTRWANGGSTFDHTDLNVLIRDCQLTNMGSDNIKISGIELGPPHTLKIIESTDNGLTWEATTGILSTYNLLGYIMWGASAQEQANFNDDALIVIQHFQVHGALYLDIVPILIPGFAVSRKFSLDLMADGSVQRKFNTNVEASGSVFRAMFHPFSFEEMTPISRTFLLPMEILRTYSRKIFLEFESDGDIVLVRNFKLPLEAHQALARLAFLPLESAEGLLFRAFQLPLEAGEGVGRATPLPMEWSGDNVLIRKVHLPLEARQIMIRKYNLPFEADGLELGLKLEWNVIDKLREPFLLQWNVIPTTQVIQFPLTWTVRQFSGNTLPLVWRVIPAEIFTLYSDDIQLPIGTVEKE